MESDYEVFEVTHKSQSNELNPIHISRAIRKRKCHICEKKLEPGTQHIKFFHNNFCNLCFLRNLNNVQPRMLSREFKEKLLLLEI